MKISINWLKDYVPLSLPAEKLAHRLTLAGLEVEKIESVGEDVVMELEITPNRPDCLNMIGIARELSAILNKNLKLPKVRKLTPVKEKCPIEILDREGCSRYNGTVISGIKLGPSPEWLQQRLLAIGLRPINNIVDITNFCMMESGQPLHAFDYDRLSGKKIIVRRARAGEKLKTLDGSERTLDPSILVIADAQYAVALAGIIGGETAEVNSGTTNILLESAHFNPVVVRRGARKLGLSTDASYRFERGVDAEKTHVAADRAISLIKELAGGVVTQRTDIFPAKGKRIAKAVSVRCEDIKKLLGADVTTTQCKTILKKLDFTVTVKNKNILNAVPPTCRNDIKREEDIIEEVARIIGYDHLPSSLPTITVSEIPVDAKRQTKEKLRQALTGLGLYETITYTLCNQAILDKTLLGDLAAVQVQNPLTQEQEMMRPALLPSLLTVALLNFNRGQKDLRLFEIGKIYLPNGKEREQLAILLTGEGSYDWRLFEKRPADFYDLKGMVLAALIKAGVKDQECAPATVNIFVPGEAAVLKTAGKEIGFLGKVNKEILKRWDIKHADAFFAQIDLEFLYEKQTPVKSYADIPTYPLVTRDVSLAVKSEISFQQIRELVQEIAGELLADLRFQELYLGEKIPAGHRGYVFSLVYQSPSRTLTEDEVNKAHDAVCRALVDRLKATIR